MWRARQWACIGVGLLISGSGPKGHGTHNAPLFLRLEDHALLVEEKYYVSGPQVWKNTMFSANDMWCPDGVFNAAFEVPSLYIQG